MRLLEMTFGDNADGLGREAGTTTTTDVLLMHAYHDCEDGQNTAACGHRFESDALLDVTTAKVETCGVCLEFVTLPCARCTA
jgi:hypothetical protein